VSQVLAEKFSEEWDIRNVLQRVMKNIPTANYHNIFKNGVEYLKNNKNKK
jgi:hypothetical protein